MDIPALLEPIAGNGYAAKTGEPLPLRAEGPTPDAALHNLKELIARRLGSGSRIVPVPVVDDKNPWAAIAAFSIRMIRTCRNGSKSWPRTDARPTPTRITDEPFCPGYRHAHPIPIRRSGRGRTSPGTPADGCGNHGHQRRGTAGGLVHKSPAGENPGGRRTRIASTLTDNVQTLSGMRILSFIEPAVRRRDDLKRTKVKIGQQTWPSQPSRWKTAPCWSPATAVILAKSPACKSRIGRSERAGHANRRRAEPPFPTAPRPPRQPALPRARHRPRADGGRLLTEITHQPRRAGGRPSPRPA